MKKKVIKHGNHSIANDNDGYMYSYNTSESYSFDTHIHKCYEIVHVIKGELLYTVEDNGYMLSSGDIILTTPKERHSFRFLKECEYEREFLHIYPGFLERFPEVIKMLNPRKSGSCNRIDAERVQKYELDTIFNKIEQCCKNPLPETDLMVLTYSVQLITIINRILTDDTPEYSNISIDSKSDFLLDYIDHLYAEEITAASVASKIFASQQYVNKILKEKTGMTIKSYLNLRRVTTAKNLIMEGQKATSIYARCGFKDYSTFYRAFIKHTGMSPDEFKNTQSRENESVRLFL